MRGNRDQGSAIRVPGSAFRRQRPSGPWPLVPGRFRRAITLLEVLVSIFILTIGVLGVAALLPIGKLALMKTEIADRTGACGRAALREVKIRRMLDPNMWSAPNTNSAVFFIDPLGYLNIGTSLAGMPRINLRTYPNSSVTLGTATTTPPSLAESIFMWQDELSYALPKDRTDGQTPNGTRPFPIVDSLTNVQQVDGRFSWFLTVWTPTAELQLPLYQRQTYNVAAVVCNRRDFTSAGETVLSSGTCTGGIGGVSFLASGTTTLKNNEWALLYQTNAQYTWYRAVGVGYDGTNTHMTLIGPDWNGGTSANLLVIPGVTGVYSTTVKLDEDGTWSK